MAWIRTRFILFYFILVLKLISKNHSPPTRPLNYLQNNTRPDLLDKKIDEMNTNLERKSNPVLSYPVLSLITNIRPLEWA